jgi:HlyD family secretion protein
MPVTTAKPEREPRDIATADRAIVAGHERRRWIAGGLVLALVAAAWWKSGGDDDGVTWRTADVERGRLVVTVSATGTLQPTNQVDVGSELSGILASVEVDFNDHVERGQLLAQLDTSKLKAEALQSEASLGLATATLAERKASVVEAEARLSRLEAVRRASGGRMPSREDLDAATATVARARASVANGEAQIALARAKLDFDETNLQRSEIRSPIKGVVLTRDVEPGQTIAASLQTPKLFTLAEDLAQMELEVDVDEADVGQVREGQEATFTVDAYPERSFPARITQLRFASETVDNVVTYKAVLQVANADLALRPGMTATAEIVTAVVENALLLPNEALRFVPPRTEEDQRGLLQKLMPFGRRLGESERPAAPSGTTRTVWRLEGGTPVSVTVNVGLSDGSRTQITGGDLAEGAALVVDASEKQTS